MSPWLNVSITALVSGFAVMWIACTPFGSHQSWQRCIAVFVVGGVVGVVNLMRPKPVTMTK